MLRRFCGFLSRMYKDKHLVPVFTNLLQDLGIANIVHGLQLLDSFFVSDTNELLFQRTRSECAIEVEQTLVWVNAEEACDVSVVRQRSTKTNDTNVVTSLLAAAKRSADNALDDWTALIVEQVNLIDTNELDEVDVAGVSRLTGNDVVLLGRCDDYLSLGNLLLRQLAITGKLRDLDAVGFQTFPKVTNLFSDQSLEGSNIYDLEVIEGDLAC